MKVSFKNSEKDIRKIKTNPEIFILGILLTIATATKQVGALGYCQIWGITVATGSLWIVFSPHHFLNCSPLDIVLKFAGIFMVGMSIVFVDWMESMLNSIALMVTDGNGAVEITVWIWFIGILLVISGLFGLVFCKKLCLVIRNFSKLKLKLYASVVFATAIFLIVKVNIANTKLISLGHIGE